MSIATLGALIIGEYPEAVAVMLFYRIGEYFENIAVNRSRTQIMNAIDMRPDTVNKIVDGKTLIVNADTVNVGDVLLIRAGDRIPLDGIVLTGSSRIDTSPITGEPIQIGRAHV